MSEFLATTPGTVLMGYVFIVGIVLLVIAAELKDYRERVEAAWEARARSMANHPAGKGRVLSERHMDTPGYDWVNGPL